MAGLPHFPLRIRPRPATDDLACCHAPSASVECTLPGTGRFSQGYSILDNNTEKSDEASGKIVAAVDLGSNSFHMIVARLQEGVLRVVDRHREMVRLADGLDERNMLSIDAQWRALACLRRFGQRLRELYSCFPYAVRVQLEESVPIPSAPPITRPSSSARLSRRSVTRLILSPASRRHA